MSKPYERRHKDQKIAKDADQAEFAALTTGSSVLDTGTYDDRIAGAMDDFAIDDAEAPESWQKDDLINDTSVGLIQEEIERRQSLLKDAYPFDLSKGQLKYNENRNLLYDFLLCICNAKSMNSGEYCHLPRQFERISSKLVKSFFGSYFQTLHTGFPRDKFVGPSFKEAMLYVGQKTHEWHWAPQPELPDDPVHGDGGCDFVIWGHPPDHRAIGQLFILGQCACGGDWIHKFDDLSTKKLGKWFNPLSFVEPVRCFTTPFHVTDSMLRDASRQAGLIFDRARLSALYYQKNGLFINKKTKNRMHELIKLVCNQ